MRLLVAAVGRLKAGPESELVLRYRNRAAKAGKALGFRAVDIVELDESRAPEAAVRKLTEARSLRGLCQGSRVIALDERGSSPDSLAFAKRLAQWRDAGEEATTLVIGGPDGLDPAFVAEADWAIALGAMTWPHQIVRVLALEQIYRTTTILSGHPYHRA